jgi:hypothetical protein
MKYILANIKIPVIINDDGTTTSLMSRSVVYIEPCTELPPENKEYKKDFSNKINNFLINHKDDTPIEIEKSSTPENVELYIKKEELIQPPRERSQNISFKKYKKISNHRLSNKRRPIIQSEDVDQKQE